MVIWSTNINNRHKNNRGHINYNTNTINNTNNNYVNTDFDTNTFTINGMLKIITKYIPK